MTKNVKILLMVAGFILLSIGVKVHRTGMDNQIIPEHSVVLLDMDKIIHSIKSNNSLDTNGLSFKSPVAIFNDPKTKVLAMEPSFSLEAVNKIVLGRFLIFFGISFFFAVYINYLVSMCKFFNIFSIKKMCCKKQNGTQQLF